MPINFKEKRPLYILKELAQILRGEDGCAWDKKQTPKTLRPYLIEEVYELYEALESDDPEKIKEELGDYLYQAFAQAQIAMEKKQFSIDEVAQGIIDKLILRHPHVFGQEQTLEADEVKARWEKIKKKEKPERKSILEGVPKHLPALLKAYRVQEKVSKVGFDWSKLDEVVLKLEEELKEFKRAVALADKDNIAEEVGDILFSLVNVLRFLEIDPESALQKSVAKFMSRFQIMEKMALREGFKLEEKSLEELDLLWEESKKKGLEVE